MPLPYSESVFIKGYGSRAGLFLQWDEARLLQEARRIVVAAVTDNLPIPVTT